MKFYLCNIIDTEYRGSHTAADHESGSPMYDLTDTYPDDIYSLNGAYYYGDGLSYDRIAISIIRAAKGKPNYKVRIYRAVPNVLTHQEKITKYENEKKYILKYGKLPKTADFSDMHRSEYYDYADNEIQKLKQHYETSLQKIMINSGDWVTITHRYAKEHGLANLKNYKIISKIVPAKHLYTTGDSIHEWGYDPNV
jgi:hypothetical protein